MNRRSFCKSLAMVPAAIIAVNVGVPVAADVVKLHNVKLQFPKLIHKGSQHGWWRSGCYGCNLREHTLQKVWQSCSSKPDLIVVGGDTLEAFRKATS